MHLVILVTTFFVYTKQKRTTTTLNDLLKLLKCLCAHLPTTVWPTLLDFILWQASSFNVSIYDDHLKEVIKETKENVSCFGSSMVLWYQARTTTQLKKCLQGKTFLCSRSRSIYNPYSRKPPPLLLLLLLSYT